MNTPINSAENPQVPFLDKIYLKGFGQKFR